MKRLLKSIISSVLACSCACVVFACGAEEYNIGSDDNMDSKQYVTDVTDVPDYADTMPNRYGIRITDGDGTEVSRTAWADFSGLSFDTHLLQEYSATLKTDMAYRLQCCKLQSDSLQEIRIEEVVDTIDDENDYKTNIYSCEFDFDSEKIEIDQTDCSYYEFNFKGLQAGECSVRFSVIYTITTHKDYNLNPNVITHDVGKSIITYNLKFTFE